MSIRSWFALSEALAVPKLCPFGTCGACERLRAKWHAESMRIALRHEQMHAAILSKKLGKRVDVVPLPFGNRSPEAVYGCRVVNDVAKDLAVNAAMKRRKK